MRRSRGRPLQSNEELRETQGQVRILADRAHGILNGLRMSPHDAFGTMGVHYLAKQLGHAEAVLRLLPHGDTQLIVRSMLEGMCQLLWASGDAEARASQWQDYVWVFNWRAARAREALGLPVRRRDSQKIARELARVGDIFKDPRAPKKPKDGRAPDPYHQNWTCLSTRKLFEEACKRVEGLEPVRIYEGHYASLSDWHHWSPAGVGRAVSRRGESIAYSDWNAADPILVLAAAGMALDLTLKVVCEYLQIEIPSDSTRGR